MYENFVIKRSKIHIKKIHYLNTIVISYPVFRYKLCSNQKFEIEKLRDIVYYYYKVLMYFIRINVNAFITLIFPLNEKYNYAGV